MDEKSLHSRLIREPEQGLSDIMDVFTAFVWTIAHGRLAGSCSNHDIEECVSDVFYEVYRTRSTIDLEKGSLKAFIAVIAKRKSVDTYRRVNRHGTNISLSADGSEIELFMTPDNAVQNAVDNETKATLIREIKSLGEPDTQIMIRKYYHGQSTKTIAKALGLKPNTVDKKVSRALAKLKENLGGAI
jgi:RNA polymerase sigma-70 factor (ECF subfamily)